ncbi:MAG: AzlD domain-containing protein [Deltaproteobacteria bacterium]|nr:AzlD domain-containing protein [Deltaproteobacteria bacterium]
MEQTQALLLIGGMALVTMLPRFLPLWLLGQRPLSRAVIAWLTHVPAAVLAAMVFPTILMRDGAVAIGLENPYFLAAIPTVAVAVWRRSLFLTLIVGMGCLAILRTW